MGLRGFEGVELRHRRLSVHRALPKEEQILLPGSLPEKGLAEVWYHFFRKEAH
jgi:hypothetical protein